MFSDQDVETHAYESLLTAERISRFDILVIHRHLKFDSSYDQYHDPRDFPFW